MNERAPNDREPSAYEPVLRAHGVAKRYGAREALREVTLEVHPGELVAVIGPNGAGKTTLLSILAGIVAPSAGTVARAGARIGWVPQQPALYSKLSVAENLRLFARLAGVREPEGPVAAMLEQIDLADRAGERVERLSGGNRQRVNVAVGLLGDPPAILLDEPSTALDPGQRERLWELVGALVSASRASVLFSTHIVGEAQRYAQRVVVLDRGRVLFDDSPAQLERAAGAEHTRDFEHAFVEFLRAHSR